jgi:hypothetical protein
MDRAGIVDNLKGVTSICISKVLVPLSSFISERGAGGVGGAGKAQDRGGENIKSGSLEREWPFSSLGDDAFVGFKVMWLRSE